MCTASCRTAKRELCECSCKGQFHKAGHTGDAARVGWQLTKDIEIDEDAGIDEVTWLATHRTGAAVARVPMNDAQQRRYESVGGYWMGPVV